MEKETLHYRTILRPFHFKTWGNIMVILQNPVHQNWSMSRIVSKKSLSVCFWQTMDLNMLQHAMLQHVFLHNLYCTFIALIFPFSQMISSLWSALLMMFILCTRSFTDVMWCNVHPSVLLCVEIDRCGFCLRMHTQLHCTQSLTDSSLIFPISEFYIFSVTKLRRFQPSPAICSLKLKFV